jgi:O-antigen/teichoic acid export membrane protein
MNSQFIRAIKWNTAGIVLYKIMLFAHQTFLYGSIPQTDYGIVGTLFSTIYFLIPVSNFGFDYTILSFFVKSKSSEESSFVLQQYFYRVCAIAGMIATTTVLYFYFGMTELIPLPLFVVCATLFFFENLKHSLRTHAHIFHLNKKIAIFENISLVGYIAAIWGYYFLHESIPMMLLFLPLAISSIAESFFIALTLIKSYKKLPQSNSKEIKSHQQFFKESGFNYINQLAKAFYSPNFLIIFLAATIGFQKTGYIKFVTNIIIFLYTIFYRSIHMSGGALFASISKIPQQLVK